MVGKDVGELDGTLDGIPLGASLGSPEGCPLGCPVGTVVGLPVGFPVGVKQKGYDVIPEFPLTSIGAVNAVREHSDVGNAPASLLLARYSISSLFDRNPNVFGTVPTKQLLLKFRCFKLDNLPTVKGIVPVKELSCK